MNVFEENDSELLRNYFDGVENASVQIEEQVLDKQHQLICSLIKNSKDPILSATEILYSIRTKNMRISIINLIETDRSKDDHLKMLHSIFPLENMQLILRELFSEEERRSINRKVQRRLYPRI